MKLTRPKVSIAALAGVVLLSGCAIHQNVRPITDARDDTICVISNPNTRDGFLLALKKSLGDKGFKVQVLPQTAALNECSLVATYEAHWRWDLAMYMSMANIKVYADARVVGEAVYDATRGGGNLNKFIDADKKVAELVTQLFPGGPRRRES